MGQDGYLVDGARDEARAISAPAEGDREGRRERRGRLHRREGLAADVVAVREAKDASDLVVRHQPCRVVLSGCHPVESNERQDNGSFKEQPRP